MNNQDYLKIDKDDRTICDKCSWYEVKGGGCTEVCHAQRFRNGNSPIVF